MKTLTSLLSALALLVTTSLVLAQGTGPAQYRVDNINALLQITLFGTDAKVTAWVGGASARDDGLGGMFFYDGNSSAATNVHAVFKPVNNTGRWWKLPTSVAYQTAAVTSSGGVDTEFAWKLLRGAGATNFLGIGADNSSAYIQTFNSKTLGINIVGANTITLGSVTGETRVPGFTQIGPTTVKTQTIGLGLANNVYIESVNVAGDTARRIFGVNTTDDLVIGANGATIDSISFLPGAAEVLNLSSSGASVGGGTAVRAIYSSAAQLDFGSIAANTAIDLTITIAGSGTNSAVTVSRADGAMTGNVNLSAWVSATNTVTVRASNPTVGAIDPATGSYRATVFQY